MIAALLGGCATGCGSPTGENCALKIDEGNPSDSPRGRLIFSAWSQNNGQEAKDITISAQENGATFSSVEIVGTDKEFFSVVTPLKPPFRLDSTQTNGLQLTIAFDAKEPRLYQAKLVLKYKSCGWYNITDQIEITLQNQFAPTKATWKCEGAALAFSKLTVGSAETKSCQLSIAGEAPLTIKGVQLKLSKGWDDKAFYVVGPNFPVTVRKDDPVTFEVRFRPTSTKDKKLAGALIFQADLSTRAERVPQLAVSGEVATSRIALVLVTSECRVDADCLDFGPSLSCQKDTYIGTNRCMPAGGSKPVMTLPLTSRGRITKRSFWIRNVGDDPLKVESIEWARRVGQDLKIVTAGVSFPLALTAKDQKRITVEYAPSDDRIDSGTIAVKSNASNPQDAMLDVNVATKGCDIDVQPRKITFGGPTSKQVTITNKGNGSCILKRVYLKTNDGNFVLLPQPTPNQTLAPNGSTSFLVKFSPNSRRPTRDFIVIESSDGDEPVVEIELSSRIVEPGECGLEVIPFTLNFGLVPVGRSRKSSVTIQNKGWGDCDVHKVSIVGTAPANNIAFQLLTPPRVPLKIAAGSNMRLDINYTPPVERAGFEGELRIESSDSRQPNYVVKLAGSSGVLCLEMLPSSLDFGAAKFGCATRTREVSVFHVGHPSCGKSISITGVKLTQNPNGEFRLNSSPTVPRTITAGQSILITASYKPRDLGVDTGTMEISHNVPGQSPIPMPLVGEGVATNDQKDVFKQLRRPLADVLFVLDNSGSTASFYNAMGQNVTSFLNWAVRLNVDYHIMITTMDLKSTSVSGGCAHGITKIVTPATANPTQTLAANLNVGTDGSATEQGLDAMYKALTAPAVHSCNKGFYRDNARLSVFFLTNESDQSSLSVDFYVKFLQHLKGLKRKHEIHVTTAAGPNPLGCRSSTSGAAAAAPRYFDLTKKLGGQFHSICTDNWAVVMSDFGKNTFVFRRIFPLSRLADPGSIVVKVNGSVIKQDPQSGWDYDAKENRVAFSTSQIPPPGSTIEVAYKAICLP